MDSYAAYIPGSFNENYGAFRPSGPRKRFDCGFDFYSPQTFLDRTGRRIMTGWMSRMDDEQEAACPTREFGYIHCLALPRVLTWEHGTLYQRPIQEVYSLRRNARTYGKAQDNFQDVFVPIIPVLVATGLFMGLRDFWPKRHFWPSSA